MAKEKNKMTTGNAYKKDIIPVFTPFSKKFWNAKKKTNSRYTLYLSYQHILHILHIKYYCSDYDFPYLIENVPNLDKNRFRFINAIPSD